MTIAFIDELEGWSEKVEEKMCANCGWWRDETHCGMVANREYQHRAFLSRRNKLFTYPDFSCGEWKAK